MGFCTYCGKQLADGETCACQQPKQSEALPQGSVPQGSVPQGTIPQGVPYQQVPYNQPAAVPSAFGIGMKEFGKLFINTIKKPIDAAEDFVEHGSIAASIIALSSFTLFYLILSGINLIVNYFRYSGSIYGWSYYYALSIGEFIVAAFFPLVWTVAILATVLGLTYAVNGIFVKAKVDIKKIAAMCGAITIGLACIVTLGTFAGLVNNSYANAFFYALQSVVGLLVFIQVLEVTRKVFTNRNKFIGAFALMAGGLYFVHYFLIAIFSNFTSYFVSLPFFG